LTDNVDDNNIKTAGHSKLITIKIGAKAMIRRNIDAILGFRNDDNSYSYFRIILHIG